MEQRVQSSAVPFLLFRAMLEEDPSFVHRGGKYLSNPCFRTLLGGQFQEDLLGERKGTLPVGRIPREPQAPGCITLDLLLLVHKVRCKLW
jgi:hypothetical protein